MKTIKILQNEYNLPENWNEINVRQLIELQKLQDEENTLDKTIKTAAILTGCEEDEIRKMDIADLMEMIYSISVVIGSGNVSNYQPNITIGGVTYHSTPVTEWSTREFVDFDTLAKDKNNLSILMALIYREEGENLDENYATKIREKSTKFLDLPASICVGAINFFSTSLLSFIDNMVSSSEAAEKLMKNNPKMMQLKRQLKELTDGAGLSFSGNLNPIS